MGLFCGTLDEVRGYHLGPGWREGVFPEHWMECWIVEGLASASATISSLMVYIRFL